MLLQWYEFCHLEEEDALYQQVSENQDNDAFDDVDSVVTDTEFLKQMAPRNRRLLGSFVQVLLNHPGMNEISG